MPENRFLGSLYGKGSGFAGGVWDKNGISPTLTTMQGGGREPMIIESQIVAMRGRDPYNPSDRTPGNPNLEQRLELNSEGISNALTTVQKDNMVLEVGHIEKGTGKHQSNVVYSENGLCLTICASYGVKQPPAMHVEIKPHQLGYIENGTGKHQSNTVYGDDNISPTITTITGGGTQQIKLLEIKQATKGGYIPCEIGGGGRFELSRQQNTQRESARKRTDKPNPDNGEYP